MNRKKFLFTCSTGCLSLLGAGLFLESCLSIQYLHGTLSGSYLEVPLDAFVVLTKNQKKFRKYIIVQHPALEYPICVYRQNPSTYKALWMRCTHQGTELQVYGGGLQCPAHGSDFDQIGMVRNGPADESLKSFPVYIHPNSLKIHLT